MKVNCYFVLFLVPKLREKYYSGQKHSKHGYLALALAACLTILDFVKLLRRVYVYFRGPSKFGFKSFWSEAILGRQDQHLGTAAEYAGLVTDEPEEIVLEDVGLKPHKQVHYEDEDAAEWANEVLRSHYHHCRTSSGETLQKSDANHSQVPAKSPLQRTGSVLVMVLERLLVVAGFAQVLSGVIIYTGASKLYHSESSHS